ncbi:ADP-ribosylglycohydrolase family protein [Planctomycetaceae bacterium SH139]
MTSHRAARNHDAQLAFKAYLMNRTAIIGCILGTAAGDALGLPYEGLSPARGVPLLGPPYRYHFLFGRGMISSDTEHTPSGDQMTHRWRSTLRGQSGIDTCDRSLAIFY